MARPSVQHTLEYDRIAALPRRVPTEVEAECWAEVWTKELCVKRSKATVRKWQGYALGEAISQPSNRGVVLWFGVGAGKTWISYALPIVTKAKRPLLIIPAGVEAKTWDDFASYHKDWVLPVVPMRVITWNWLALNPDFLNQYQPTDLIIDESDELANLSRGAPAIIDRYVMRTNPQCRVHSMTATPERLSLMNFWHILRWSLREGLPLPSTQGEARMWAASVDEKIRDPQMRPSPGPLGVDSASAREWIRRRILETPGVVIVDGDSCDQPLTIQTRLAKEDPILDEHYRIFLRKNQNPGGIQVDVPLSRWQLDCQQMGCGLYSRYVREPPVAWREANRARAKFVRDAIARSWHTGNPLYTERPVLERYATHPTVQRWLRVKDTFDAETEIVWLSRSTIESCLDWLREQKEPCIIWTGSVEFGEALARAAKLPYYGAKGKCAGGGLIHRADPKRSFVASWNANKKGLNLQAWSRFLLVAPPQSAKWLEQIFGRVHRSGQLKPVVGTILLTSGGTIDLFEAAIAEARFAKSVTSLTQKILNAKIVRAVPRITDADQWRWASRTKAQPANNRQDKRRKAA
jgi:hypothetical protein